jgi:phospholipase D-like protein
VDRPEGEGRAETESRDREVHNMLIADSYPFLNIMWTMFIFFAWVIWISLLVMILIDNFRRSDHSGWAKAGWTLFVIFLPLIGVLVYMIARPSDLPTGMERV